LTNKRLRLDSPSRVSNNQSDVEPTSSTYPQPTPANRKEIDFKDTLKRRRPALVREAKVNKNKLAEDSGDPDRMYTSDDARNFLEKKKIDVSQLEKNDKYFIRNFRNSVNEKSNTERLKDPEYQKLSKQRPALVRKAKVEKNKLAEDSGDPDRMYTDDDARKFFMSKKIDITQLHKKYISKFCDSVNAKSKDHEYPEFSDQRPDLVMEAKVEKNKLAEASRDPDRNYTNDDSREFLKRRGIDIIRVDNCGISAFTLSVNTKPKDPEYQEFSDRLLELVEKAKVDKNNLAVKDKNPNRKYTDADSRNLLEKNKIDIIRVGNNGISSFTQRVNEKSRAEQLNDPEYQKFLNQRQKLIENLIADKNKKYKNPDRTYTHDDVRKCLIDQQIDIRILNISDIKLLAEIVNKLAKKPKQVSEEVRERRERAEKIRQRNSPPVAPKIMCIKREITDDEIKELSHQGEKQGGKIVKEEGDGKQTVIKMELSDSALKMAKDIKPKIEAEAEAAANTAAEAAAKANHAVEAAIKTAIEIKDVVEVEGEVEGAVEGRDAVKAAIKAAAEAKLKADNQAETNPKKAAAAHAAAKATVEAIVEAAAEAAPVVQAVAVFMPTMRLKMKDKVKTAMKITIEAVADAKGKARDAAEAADKVKRMKYTVWALPAIPMRSIVNLWGSTDTQQGREAAVMRQDRYEADKKARDAKKDLMKLEDKFVKDLIEQIKSFYEGEKQRGNYFSKYPWGPLNKEEVVEREIILGNLNRLIPVGLLQRCQNLDLFKAILDVRDQEMFDIFIRKITEAVQIRRLTGGFEQLNQQVRNLFDDSCMEQMKQIRRDWSDEPLSSLISTMVKMANTAVSVQNILDLLKGGTREPNTQHAAILNNVKNKQLENKMCGNGLNNFDDQIVNFLDQYIAHLETILDTKDDPEYQKLKNQLLTVNILFDEKLNEIKSTLINDADLFKIAKKLKKVTNLIYERRPITIEPKIIAKTLNIIRARIGSEALQRRLVDNQIKYLPKSGVAWLIGHIRKKPALPDPVQWAFIAGLPEFLQKEIYGRQPTWRPNIEVPKPTTSAMQPTTVPEPEPNEEEMDVGMKEDSEIAQALDRVMDGQDTEPEFNEEDEEEMGVGMEEESEIAQALDRVMDKQKKRKKQDELREQARNHLLPQTNATSLQESLPSGRRYRLPREFKKAEMIRALALLEKKKILLQPSENRKEVADIVKEIESSLSGIEEYGLQRFGDGTVEGTSFGIIMEVLTRRNPSDLKRRLRDYKKYHPILKRRREELPVEDTSDLLPQAKRQKLDECIKQLEDIIIKDTGNQSRRDFDQAQADIQKVESIRKSQERTQNYQEAR